MLYSKKQVQENLRTRDGKRVFFLGKDDLLTNEAKDYLTGERIEILPAEQAKPAQYQLLNGSTLAQKPEHMTHLQGNVLVAKTHPRIRFRGAVDMLEGSLLLAQQALPLYTQKLQEILNLSRRLIRCDVLDEPVGEFTLWGMGEQEQRKRSHFPQEYYGIPHFMPEYTDSREILELNRLRCMVRQTELAAAEAFQDRDGQPTRPDILQTLNRMSSALYILMLQEKAKNTFSRGEDYSPAARYSNTKQSGWTESEGTYGYPKAD